MVLICPLTLVEAIQNAHNDALLMLMTALAVLFWVQGRRLVACLPLGVGFLCKYSGALLLAVLGPVWTLDRLRGLWKRPLVLITLGGTLTALLVVLAWLVAHRSSLLGSELLNLIGSPTERAEFHCIRAIECLPRLIFLRAFDMPAVSFGLGLLFRGLGIAWLVFCVVQAHRDGRVLSWAGTFLFVFLLYFYQWSCAWYRLALLPLVPFAARRVYPAMVAWILGAFIYYALDLVLTCQSEVLPQVAVAVSQAIFLIALPSWMLIRHRRSRLVPLLEVRI